LKPPPLLWLQPASEKATEVKDTVLGLQALPQMQLRKEWLKRYGAPIPAPRSTSLLLRLLAWRIQADAFGGHSPEVLMLLNEPVKHAEPKKKTTPDDDLPSGTVLKRDWRGRVHRVFVTKDGFGHEGKTYKTLPRSATRSPCAERDSCEPSAQSWRIGNSYKSCAETAGLNADFSLKCSEPGD